MCSQTGAQIRTITILKNKPYKSSRVYTLLNHSHWSLHVKGKRCGILNLHKLFFIYFSFFALLALYIFFLQCAIFCRIIFAICLFATHPRSGTNLTILRSLPVFFIYFFAGTCGCWLWRDEKNYQAIDHNWVTSKIPNYVNNNF